MTLPNPRPLDTTQADRLHCRNIDQFKQVFCKFYDRCLVVAARARWHNFHCNSCHAFEDLPKGELVKEGSRLADIIFEVGKP